MVGTKRSVLGNDSISRRTLLKAVCLAGMSSLMVAACSGGASAPAAAPTSAPAAAAASAPAAAPTSAPAAAAPAAPAAAPTTAAASSGNAQPQATAAPATGPAVTLSWFLPLSAAPEIAIWTDFVKRFQTANPNITIKGAYESWGNYWTKLETVMAGGAIPDVVWLHYTRVAEWASKDVMRPLDANLAADKLDPKSYVFNDSMDYKGHMYALPKDNGVNALWYNIDMYSKAGVPVPTFTYTWDDWLTGMKKLTVDRSGKTADQSGFNASDVVRWGTVQPQTNSPRGEGFYIWFASMGGKLYNADMTQSMIDQPESISALQFMADIVV